MGYNERLFVRVEVQSIGDEIIKISREYGMAAMAIIFVAHELRQGAIAESRIFAGGQALDLLLASVGLEKQIFYHRAVVRGGIVVGIILESLRSPGFPAVLFSVF